MVYLGNQFLKKDLKNVETNNSIMRYYTYFAKLLWPIEGPVKTCSPVKTPGDPCARAFSVASYV